MSDDHNMQKASVSHEIQATKKGTLAFVLCSIFYAVFMIGKMWVYKGQWAGFHDAPDTILVSLYPAFLFCVLSAWVVCKTSGPVLQFTRKAVFRLALNCLLSVAGLLLIVAGSEFAINQYTFFSHHHIAFMTDDYDDGQYMNCVFLSKDKQPSSSVKIWVQNGLYDYQQQKFTFIDRNGLHSEARLVVQPYDIPYFYSNTKNASDISLSFNNAQETCHLAWMKPDTDQIIEKDGWFGWSDNAHDLGDWKMSKMINKFNSRLQAARKKTHEKIQTPERP